MRTKETIIRLLKLKASVILSAENYSVQDLKDIATEALVNKTQATLVFGNAFSDHFICELAAIGGEYLCIDLGRN